MNAAATMRQGRKAFGLGRGEISGLGEVWIDRCLDNGQLEIMKQGHSFHRLFFHLVFSTKNREHLICSPADGLVLAGFFKAKAHDLDAYLEEFGCWREHVHLLVRIPPKLALAKLYRQLKGFASHSWKERCPDDPFAWQDGAFSCTVDPDSCTALRDYIRGQWEHHESKTTITPWEPPVPGLQMSSTRTVSPPQPAGLAVR